MAEQPDTKERILDAAEALFAEHGFAHTSMRNITSMANVNLAAVNYHFGSKEELIKAVFTRRLAPINAERTRRLDELERRGDASLEDLLEAFIAPSLETSKDHASLGDRFVKLIGLSYTENTEVLRDHVYQLNRELASRFKTAFQKALPHLPKQELSWRLHFLVGSVAYTMAGPDLIHLMAGSQICEGGNARALVARLVPFLAGGLRAPLPADLPAIALRHAS
jgi:AcrR family transcriptional regulator